MLDLIVDHLCDDLEALKPCCVVSKSWIPRARRHIFVRIDFHAHVWSIESWMKAFPDPPTSPAHYARSLLFHDSASTITAATNASPWIRAFCCIDTLRVCAWTRRQFSFIHLHGLSPALKSLCVSRSSIPLSDLFDFVGSFPSLEDLSLTSSGITEPDGGWAVVPPVSPKFTGRLYLLLDDGTQATVQRLLDFPGGLHFSGIEVMCHEREAESVVELLSSCFHTLESLFLRNEQPGAFLWLLGLLNGSPTPVGSDNFGKESAFDLSGAAKLKELRFSWGGQSVQWIITTLQTTATRNLRYITLHSYSRHTFDIDRMDPTVLQGWQDLDRLLVQMWTSHSIRPSITYVEFNGGLGGVATILLPKLTGAGVVEAASD